MNEKVTAAALLGVAAAIFAAGCHSTPKAAAAHASVSAFAQSSQGQYDKAQAQKLARKCVPQGETAQLKLAEPAKGKTARTAVENCLAIPQASRTAFGDALLNDAVHGHLGTSAGRVTFAEVTVPELIVRYHG